MRDFFSSRDPRQEFLLILAEAVIEGCRTDEDCGPLLSCINRQCINPCVANDPCTGNQECVVQDSPGGRPVVACICPDGMIAGDNGRCEPGEVQFYQV